MPALYLDTLKVSTVEKTGESTWAQGGLGNARLINWDYGKTINVTLEDALCTPASLGLCWGGILSADWKDAHVDYNSDVCVCRNPLVRLSRMEKAIYPSGDRKTVSRLLPQTPDDSRSIDDLELLRISSIVDGTKINGIGMVGSKTYNWKMAIESAVKSIAVVPDRFFDIKGRSYSIDQNRKISADSLPTYHNYKSAVIYRINTTSNFVVPPIAEIIFDNEMQNRCGIEQTAKFSIIDYIDYDYCKISDHSIIISQSEYDALTAEQKAEYEKAGATEKDYNLFELLGKTKALYEKGVVNGNITGQDDELKDIEFITTKTVEADKLHFVLCPKNRVISVTKSGINNRPKYDKATDWEISIRIFSLNNYGIKKYLNNDPGNLIAYSDIANTLVKYLQNHATTNMFDYTGRPVGNEDKTWIKDEFNDIEDNITATKDLEEGEYLAIIIDANNNYHALVGVRDSANAAATDEDAFAQAAVKWYKPSVDVNVTQFQGIDMWLRFESVNEMIYFLITKYEQDIQEIRSTLICPKDETSDGNWDVNRNRTALHMSTKKEDKKEEGALWAYVNPRTMQPYSDDYWFHQGDPYYVKSLTLAQDGKRIKGNQITVKADEWPGMYMVVGETRIRNRDTGEDERVQLKFPQCKVKADQTLTLSADGDPTTFTINLEVAKPRNGHMMEITAYEIATKMTEGENGCYYAIDGSSKVVTE